ncbi:MAG: hypothetical protein QOI01_1985 [Mycobacterium sp.]|jgi:hypothetical protein|nr:hypothetical protein [Mycobacterium sp.]
MKLAAMDLQQRDGVSCGPAVAVMAGALLDPSYACHLTGSARRAWFDAEQGRVHAAANRIWPRALGTTPWGMARTISAHSARYCVRYGWRLPRRRDALCDVQRAVSARWPVAMLVGNAIPRHWVLIVEVEGDTLGCYEPSSGEVRSVSKGAVRAARLTGLGFGRPFALVLPRYRLPEPRSNI